MTTLVRKVYRSHTLDNGKTEQVLCHEPLYFSDSVLDVTRCDWPLVFNWISPAEGIDTYFEYYEKRALDLVSVICGFCRYRNIFFQVHIGVCPPEIPTDSKIPRSYLRFLDTTNIKYGDVGYTAMNYPYVGEET